MKLRSIALTAVTAGAVGIAGCGGDDASTSAGGSNAVGDSTDAKTILAKTFEPASTAKIKSGDIELKVGGSMSGSITASGNATANIKLNAGQDGEVPEFSADVAVKGEQKGGQKIDLKAGGTLVDNRVYVSYDGDNYDVGEELSKRAIESLKTSIKQSGSSGSATSGIVSKLGLDPQTWLTNPKVAGDEKIGGTDTVKITGAVDVKALVPDILDAAKKAQSLAPAGTAGVAKIPEVTDAQLDQVVKQIKKLDVTIWTGKDDAILRKLAVDLEFDDAGTKLDGQLELTLTDVNEKQDISAPSDTKPITDLMPKLGGLFGAAAGGGLGSTGAASGAGGAVSDAYVQCVNAAGGDAAKLNDCQKVLQGTTP